MRTVLTLKFLERSLDRISIEILLIMCFVRKKVQVFSFTVFDSTKFYSTFQSIKL